MGRRQKSKNDGAKQKPDIGKLLKRGVLGAWLPSRSYLGVDLGASRMKLVEVRVMGKQARIIKAVQVPTPPGAIEGGEIKNPLALLDTLEEALTRHSMTGRKVIASLSGKQVMTRQLRVPAMPEEELAAAIRWEAEKYIPLPFDDLVFDYINLGEMEEDGLRQTHVLIATAPKQTVDLLADILEEAGLTPLAVEIAPIALWRAHAFPKETGTAKKGQKKKQSIRFTYNLKKNTDNGNYACLDLGCESSQIVYFKNRLFQFNRSLSFGGRQLTEEIAKTLNISLEEAERIKIENGVILSGKEVDPDNLSLQLDMILRSFFAEVITEVKRSLEFVKVQTKSTAEKLILTGGTARLRGLAQWMAEELEIPVVVGDPFEYFKDRQLPLDGEILRNSSPTLSVGVGLALREVVG